MSDFDRKTVSNIKIGSLRESYDKDGEETLQSLYLTREARRHHTLLEGGKNSGKTEVIRHMALEDFKNDIPLIYFHCSSDTTTPALFAKTLEQRRELDRFFYSTLGMSNELQDYSMLYNPLSELIKADQVNDPAPVLNLLNDSIEYACAEPFCDRQDVKKLIERFVHAVSYSGRSANIDDLLAGITGPDPRRKTFSLVASFLESQPDVDDIKQAVKPLIVKEKELYESWTKNNWQQVPKQARNRMKKLTCGAVGQHLRTYTPHISIDKLIKNNGLWVVQLPPNAEQSGLFCNLILHQLHYRANQLRRNNRKAPLSVYFDGVTEKMPELFVQHLRQSGEAGFMFNIALSDHDMQNKITNSESVYNNIGNIISFRSSDRKADRENSIVSNFDQKDKVANALSQLPRSEAVVNIKVESDYPDIKSQITGSSAQGRYAMVEHTSSTPPAEGTFKQQLCQRFRQVDKQSQSNHKQGEKLGFGNDELQ